MITKQDLIKLGYSKKQDRNLGRAISEDFRFGEPGERDYLVNLSDDGVVNVEFGIKKGQGSVRRKPNITNITSIDEFIDWHNAYGI